MRYFKLGVAVAVISFLGFLDASYLTIEHYRGTVPPCSIVVGCEVVTTSKFSVVFTVPVALLGALYYLTIFILALAYLDTGSEKIILWGSRLTVAGFLASLWFIFLQQFIVNAWCIYCLASAASSISLFFIGMWIWNDISKRSRETLQIQRQ